MCEVLFSKTIRCYLYQENVFNFIYVSHHIIFLMDIIDQLLEKFHEVQTPGMEIEITSE